MYVVFYFSLRAYIPSSRFRSAFIFGTAFWILRYKCQTSKWSNLTSVYRLGDDVCPWWDITRNSCHNRFQVSVGQRTSDFRRVRKTAKANISFVMSVCPSACNSSAPTGWIFMKLDICIHSAIQNFRNTVFLIEDIPVFLFKISSTGIYTGFCADVQFLKSCRKFLFLDLL
jgi:hypothetical protein